MEKQKNTVSGIEIRKAHFNDMENVVKLLENFSSDPSDHWRKIFAPRSFTVEDDFPGFVIVDQQKIVGFLGTIFSEHETPRGKFKICNLTTWYVEPEYRQYGMMLFIKIMKIPNVSWTNLTAAPHIYELFNRSGFKMLEDKQLLMLPLPKLFRRKRHDEIKINTKIVETDLHANLQPIHRMHQHLHCKPILISKGNEQCYCLIVITRYKKIPLAKIYYMSNENLFKDVIDDIRLTLCWKLRVCYLQIEGNILQEKKMRGVFIKNIYPPRLFKSSVLSKEEMTILGSELFVLGI